MSKIDPSYCKLAEFMMYCWQVLWDMCRTLSIVSGKVRRNLQTLHYAIFRRTIGDGKALNGPQ